MPGDRNSSNAAIISKTDHVLSAVDDEPLSFMPCAVGNAAFVAANCSRVVAQYILQDVRDGDAAQNTEDRADIDENFLSKRLNNRELQPEPVSLQNILKTTLERFITNVTFSAPKQTGNYWQRMGEVVATRRIELDLSSPNEMPEFKMLLAKFRDVKNLK